MVRSMAAETVTTSDGVRIAVHDLGGTGRPLLIAHATGFHGRAYAPLARLLGDRRRCVAFDARGHGGSGLPPGLDFEWHGFARDVLAVVDGLGPGRPAAVGHSCGGAALLLAEQARPGTFEAVYCFEPIVYPGDDPPAVAIESPMSQAARRRREVFASRAQAFDNYASKPPLDLLERDCLAAYVEYGFEDLPDGSVRLCCRGESEAAVYAASFSHDAFRHLAEIACPVTLACGERTDTINREYLELLAARLARCRVEELAGLSHFGPLEDPAAVAASVMRAFDTPPA
jgi:pimeloyl-ACP methyl ester carboxylesterase